jgi:hypothetical protein
MVSFELSSHRYQIKIRRLNNLQDQPQLRTLAPEFQLYLPIFINMGSLQDGLHLGFLLPRFQAMKSLFKSLDSSRDFYNQGFTSPGSV